jgi:uncharacterized protein
VAFAAKRIGLISDTHGLLRPEALAALQGSDLILHAGDVGKPEILEALRNVAPVVAVRGNTDVGPYSSALRAAEVVETESALLYMLHDVSELDLDPAGAGFRAVISGHSHKPARSLRSGILYLNPGSAGPKRFSLPTTIARLDLGANPWKVDFVDVLARRLLMPQELG